VLRLLAFVLPLAVDSFVVAAALGAAGRLGWRDRARVSAVFVAFETGMPLLGVAAGDGLAGLIGPAADYVAAAVVLGTGGWMLIGRDDDEQEAARLTRARGWALVWLGVGISLDEFAVGAGLGLTRLPVLPVIIAIAVQALVASQAGLALGALVGDRFRDWAERAAGIALVLLGGYLIAARLGVFTP
jgi:putative Mn2+ efflux pump MntP